MQPCCPVYKSQYCWLSCCAARITTKESRNTQQHKVRLGQQTVNVQVPLARCSKHAHTSRQRPSNLHCDAAHARHVLSHGTNYVHYHKRSTPAAVGDAGLQVHYRCRRGPPEAVRQRPRLASWPLGSILRTRLSLHPHATPPSTDNRPYWYSALLPHWPLGGRAPCRSAPTLPKAFPPRHSVTAFPADPATAATRCLATCAQGSCL